MRLLLQMKAMASTSDAELLTLARRDASAFALFYDRYESPLLAFVVRLTGRPDVAVDIVSEVFAILLEQVRRGKQVREPRAWLYTVARREIISGFRRGQADARARQRLAFEVVELSDESFARVEELASDDSDMARAALEALPDDQRAAVAARVIDGIDYREIAARMSCSEAVVRKRVSRGLGEMRRSLEGQST